MLTRGDIERIAECVIRGCRPQAVGVFGSYAVGRAHAGSDLDLFVIQETNLLRSERRRAALRTLQHVLHPLDIHVFTPQEFELEAQEPLSFAWVIARQADVLHMSDEALLLVPSLRARQQAVAR